MSIFVETVERILADHVTPALIEAAERGDPPAALMAALEENGLFALFVSESAGGIGATMADAVACMRCVGAAAAPGPILETLIERAGISGVAAHQTAALLNAARISGAIRWIFERTATYATERVQFGKPLSKQQAVQQMLALLADNALAAAAITDAAAAEPSPRLIAAARARLGDASDCAIEVGHQVHGALGFTREYALNYRTRNLIAWRDQYGSVLEWKASLARMFVGSTRDGFWPAITGLRT
jgi:alkylation response protein AidB-like acyl-CoA dehydrogenase